MQARSARLPVSTRQKARPARQNLRPPATKHPRTGRQKRARSRLRELHPARISLIIAPTPRSGTSFATARSVRCRSGRGAGRRGCRTVSRLCMRWPPPARSTFHDLSRRRRRKLQTRLSVLDLCCADSIAPSVAAASAVTRGPPMLKPPRRIRRACAAPNSTPLPRAGPFQAVRDRNATWRASRAYGAVHLHGCHALRGSTTMPPPTVGAWGRQCRHPTSRLWSAASCSSGQRARAGRRPLRATRPTSVWRRGWARYTTPGAMDHRALRYQPC